MKCGICGATKYHPIDRVAGERRENAIRISDASDLIRHKALDHKEAYAAQIRKMREGKDRKKQERREYGKRVHAATVAAAKPTIVQQTKYNYEPGASGEDGELQAHIGYREGTTAEVAAYNSSRPDHRYPAEFYFEGYQSAMKRIAMIQAAADQLLANAWEFGEMVPDEDFEAVSQAKAAVQE